MKKTLLFGFALGVVGLSYGQCDIMGLETPVCLSDAPSSLSVASPGATFSGPGMSGSVFTPADAGLGTHTITVEAPGEGYSHGSATYAPIPLVAPITVSGLSDDNVVGSFPIGFTFNFFGNDYSNFYIGSNGFLTFNSGMPSGCCSGQLLPSATNPNNLIAYSWEDLDPGNGGAPAINLVRYETQGTAPNRVLIVDFYRIDHFSSGDNVTAQVHLYETTNCIEVHIETQPATCCNHTLGIENATGTEAYAAPGKNAASWTATNFAYSFCPNVGCTGEFVVEVVAAPNVDGTADVTEICLGEEITLTASGTADEYSWGVGIEDGEPFTPGTPGANVYIVSGVDTESGCIGTDAVNVYVHDIPYVYAGDDTSYCEDWEFVLAAIGDEADYAWDNGAVDGVPMTQDVGTVTYTVTATNEGGCEATSSVTIESLEVPTGTGVVTMMTGMGYDGEIDFTPTGGTGGPYTFLWSNGETTEDLTALPVGTYTVTVSDGQCDSDVTFTVDSQAGIELNELGNLKVYPNPVVDQFTIDFEGAYNWTLYDNAGKVVANGNAAGKKAISMENMAAGSYVVQVEVDGKKSTVALVKE